MIRQSVAGRRFVFLLFLSLLWQCISGAVLRAQEEPEEAPKEDLPTLQKKLADAETSKGKDNAELVPILTDISKAYREQGAYIPALPFARRALEIAEKAHAADLDDVAVAAQLDYLATIYRLVGDYKSAIEDYRKAGAIVEKKLGAEHPASATLLNNLGIACLGAGENEEAESALDKALNVANKVYGAAAPEVTDIRLTLAELYLRTGRFARAEQQLIYAITIRSEGLDIPLMAGQTSKPEVLFYMAPVRNMLGRLYTVVGFYDKADEALTGALKDYEGMLGKDHPWVEDVLVNLVALDKATGKTDEAAAYQKRVDEIYDKHAGLSHAEGAVRPKAIDAVIPAAGELKLYPDARVGDWVSYSRLEGVPFSKMEVMRKTALVAIVRNSSWDDAEKKWEPGLDQITDLPGSVKETYGIAESDLKSEKVRVKEHEVAGLSATSVQEGMQCKVVISPENVPVGGMVKMECDEHVMMQVMDFGRGK